MSTLTRGERFKDARTVHNQHKKQTMDEVAAATGLQKTLIQALEDDGNARSVGYDKVAKLAAHYGVTSDYLLGLTSDPNRKPCAADELGLSPKVISNLSLAWHGDETGNALLGVNALLDDYYHFYNIFLGIGSLKNVILAEEERAAEYTKQEAFSPIGQSREDEYTMNQEAKAFKMMLYLKDEYPELMKDFYIITEAQYIDNHIADIVEQFRRTLYLVTGYDEYAAKRKQRYCVACED